ncbi:Zinc finger C2HC domain-containing protein 1C [Globomyces sp. JEL0801]|nr:Zinc finger C2HC domain-containing protein 1C [Globomyces sp. JEL0801]
MISTHEQSRHGTLSANQCRLCHVCGEGFPKASLPSHQRSCIRRSMRTGQSSRIVSTLSAGSGTLFSCSKCSIGIPQYKVSSHLRECTGDRQADILQYNEVQSHLTQIPSSAPTTRRFINKPKEILKKTNQREKSFTNYLGNELDNQKDAAAAAETPNVIYPKKSIGLQHTLSKIQNDESYETSISKTKTQVNSNQRKVVVQMSRNESRSNIELSIAKKKVTQADEKPIPVHSIDNMNGKLYKDKIQSLMTQKLGLVNQNAIKAQHEEEEYNHEEMNDESNHQQGVSKVPHPSFHENSETELLDVSKYLVGCDICGRKFMEDRLEKHVAICSKANTKQRKVFDVKAARVQGTELEKYALRAPKEEPPKPKSHWRAKHAAFRQMVIAARQPAGSKGALANVPTIDPNPDYISCPSCDRRFNEDSGKRHIPICKEKAAKKAMEKVSHSRNNMNPSGKDKNEELKRRTAYKPPSPRKPKK